MWSRHKKKGEAGTQTTQWSDRKLSTGEYICHYGRRDNSATKNEYDQELNEGEESARTQDPDLGEVNSSYGPYPSNSDYYPSNPTSSGDPVFSAQSMVDPGLYGVTESFGSLNLAPDGGSRLQGLPSSQREAFFSHAGGNLVRLVVQIDTGCSLGSLWIHKKALKMLGKHRNISKLDRRDGNPEGPDINGEMVRPQGKINLSFRYWENGKSAAKTFWVLPDNAPYDVVFGNNHLDEADTIDYDDVWKRLEEKHGYQATFSGVRWNERESKATKAKSDARERQRQQDKERKKQELLDDRYTGASGSAYQSQVYRGEPTHDQAVNQGSSSYAAVIPATGGRSSYYPTQAGYSGNFEYQAPAYRSYAEPQRHGESSTPEPQTYTAYRSYPEPKRSDEYPISGSQAYTTYGPYAEPQRHGDSSTPESQTHTAYGGYSARLEHTELTYNDS